MPVAEIDARDVAGAAVSPPSMLFVVGNSRSGTTMLGNILGAHSDVHRFDELQIFERVIEPDDLDPPATWARPKLIEVGAQIVKLARHGLFARVDPRDYRDEVAQWVDGTGCATPVGLYSGLLGREARRNGKPIACEQTPRYLFVARQLLAAYPSAHVVHIYRDPRSVMLSQKNRWRRGFMAQNRTPLIWTLRSWSNYHPYLTARIWGAAMRHARGLADHPRFHEVSYEALLSDPEPKLSALCRAIALDYQPSMLDIPHEGSSSRDDVPTRRGLDPSRVEAWRSGGLTRAEIAICERVAGDEMRRRGFVPSGVTVSAPGRAVAIAASLPKLVAAVFLNAGRFGNLISVARRRLTG